MKKYILIYRPEQESQLKDLNVLNWSSWKRYYSFKDDKARDLYLARLEMLHPAIETAFVEIPEIINLPEKSTIGFYRGGWYYWRLAVSPEIDGPPYSFDWASNVPPETTQKLETQFKEFNEDPEGGRLPFKLIASVFNEMELASLPRRPVDWDSELKTLLKEGG